METLTVLGLAGQDTFQLIPSAGVGGFPLDNLLVNLDGGLGSNALVVASTFAGAASAGHQLCRGQSRRHAQHRHGARLSKRRGQSRRQLSPACKSSRRTWPAPTSRRTCWSWAPTSIEPNESQGTAAFLGSNTSIEVEHAAIFPNATEFPSVPADIDFYRIVAGVTGTLDLSVSSARSRRACCRVMAC